MIIIGLTGSIAMGKTETSRMFQRLQIPTYDADDAVHQLYAKGGEAVKAIDKLCPDVIVNGKVDRHKLSQKIIRDPKLIPLIENIVHPLVRKKQTEFVETSKRNGARLIVLDIPLLFETGGENRVDKVVVVSASEDVQKKRALERPGMTPEKLDLILSKQVPDKEKREKADYIVETDKGLEHAFRQVQEIVADLSRRDN